MTLTRKSTCFCIVMAVVLCVPLSAMAAAPDAGTILREQKQATPSIPERLPKPDEKTDRPAGKDAAMKVMVKSFRFTAIEGIATDAELQALVADSVGKELTMSQLQGVAETVTAYLREKGFLLAKGYLPKQEITDGTVEIAVIAGRIEGGANIRVKQPSRIKADVLKDLADGSVRNGEIVNSTNLERSIMLINDLPGVTGRATLEKGTTPGTTRVVIDAEEGPLFSGALSGDNFGNRYTGVWRGTAQANLNDAFGIGDQFNLSLTGAEHLFQGRVGYSMPLGSSGLRGNLSYTGLYYELGKDLTSLKANGRADTLAAGASYPLFRSRTASSWLGLSYEYRMLTDEASSVKTKDRKIHAGTADLFTTVFDGLNGGGMTTLKLAVSGGNIDLSGVATDEAADATTAKTAGSYFKFNYTVSRLQRLFDSLALYLSANGQLTGGNLDSSEKFILGGNNGVRSYPGGEGNGDEGHVITAELRYDVPFKSALGTLQLIGFYDTGFITLHENVWTSSVSTATGKNNYRISGAGAGINLAKAGLYSLRTSWAQTVGGDNPGRSTAGNNADGTKADNRFWFYGVVYF